MNEFDGRGVGGGVKDDSKQAKRVSSQDGESTTASASGIDAGSGRSDSLQAASERRAVSEEERARDLLLVEAAKSGDRQAFGKLVERYQRRVYALAFGILRQREDAWDVAQEAFVKAYRNLDRFEGQAAFYTWVYRIAYNLSIDTLRDKTRRDAVDIGERRMEEALEREGRHPSGNPDESTERKELAEVLESALGKLSEKHRAIIVLREVEGLSYEEMAEVLGISKGTVMSRLFHARQNLQALLLPYVNRGEGVPANLRLAVQGS